MKLIHIVTAVATATSLLHAVPSVEQSLLWTDGDVGFVTDDSIPFDVVNAGSILIATLYVDGNTPDFTSVVFGDGGGLGSGDVAPEATFTDGRLTSFIFLDPSTDSGLSFRFTKTTTGGVAATLYEVTGAKASLADITTSLGSNSIDTATADELVVSFAGRNGAFGAPSVTASSIFADEDWQSAGNDIRGGGYISSASAVAPAIGSQDISWNNAADGRIAHAFEAGSAVAAASLSGFTYNPADGSALVSISGAPETRYQLVEADDLDFANPDQSPVPLDGATVGTLSGDVVVTDTNGDATVQFNLGTAKAATFIRAEEVLPPGPLLDENFDDAAALPTGWISSGPSEGTDWEVGSPSGVLSGPAAAFSEPHCAATNIGGYYTGNADVTLTTVSFTVPDGASATLRFRQLIDTDSAGDSGSVRILDAGDSDSPIAGLEIIGLQGLGSDGGGWTEQTLALPAGDVGGKTIKVQFGFVSDAGSTEGVDVFGGFYIDDVSVTLD